MAVVLIELWLVDWICEFAWGVGLRFDFSLVLCDSVFRLLFGWGVWCGYLCRFDCCCIDLLVNSVVLILLFN